MPPPPTHHALLHNIKYHMAYRTLQYTSYVSYLPLDNNTHSRTSIWTPKTASYGIIWMHHMKVHGYPLHAHAGMCGRRNWEGNVLWNHTAHTHIEGPRWYIIFTSFRIKVSLWGKNTYYKGYSTALCSPSVCVCHAESNSLICSSRWSSNALL